MQQYIKKTTEGFKQIQTADAVKESAIEFLERWLRERDFSGYHPQIQWVADQGNFPLLLDSFYQVLPFGTGGRRGPVGIGPNRINPWTIAASAQGHSEYLLKTHGDAHRRGVVIAYDCRRYPDVPHYNHTLPNPVRGITSRDLALVAASVYTANGIPVHFFVNNSTTPNLSFAIRALNAVGGVNISASHNPKEDNGKKIYNEDGGQLIPPFDQILVDTVSAIEKIKHLEISKAQEQKLFHEIPPEIDTLFVKSVVGLSLSKERALKVVYAPLHGVGSVSIYPVLQAAGFDVEMDPATATQDGAFTNVKFNIPNPEVPESFETAIKHAKKVGADVVLASDPDADRLGIAVSHKGNWKLLTGNEMSAILLKFKLDALKNRGELTPKKVMVKTDVTTSLCTMIAHEYGIEVVDDLLVGFKYIADVIKKLEREGREKDFVIGVEESYGYLVGTYARDKDAAGAALLVCELAAEQKKAGKTVVDYLDALYKHYGYVENSLSSIIMQGAVGRAKMSGIQKTLRENPPQSIGSFKMAEIVDFWKGNEHKSETDTVSRNMLSFHLKGNQEIVSAKITIRPSGTEPKTKVYIEVVGRVLGDGVSYEKLDAQKKSIHAVTEELERSFMKTVFQILDIEMPEHAYKLSSLLPLEAKIKYVEIEPEIITLKERRDSGEISHDEFLSQLDALFAIFGKDPIEKISPAFEAKFGTKLRDYLGL